MLNSRITRRKLLKGSLATLATLAVAPDQASACLFRRRNRFAVNCETFKLCINIDEHGILNPAEIAPGWDRTEIPVTQVIKPFSTEEEWRATKARIESWRLPPTKTAGCFNEGIIRATRPPGR